MHVCLSHQNSKIQVLATVTVMKITVTPVQLLLVCFHTWNVCGVDVVKFVVLVFLVAMSLVSPHCFLGAGVIAVNIRLFNLEICYKRAFLKLLCGNL